MERIVPRKALVVVGIGCAVVGCGNGDDSAAPTSVLDAGGPADARPTDATTTHDAQADANGSSQAPGDATAPAYAFARLAQWSIDAGPIDFCLASPGSPTFHGPFLSTNFTSDGGILGVDFPGPSSTGVTAYLATPAGPFDVRVIAAGSQDCTCGIGLDAKNAALATKSLSTIALIGETAPGGGLDAATEPCHGGASSGDAGAYGPQVVVLPDDPSAPTGYLAVRFVNALPLAPPVTLGTSVTTGSATVQGGSFFTGVAYGTASSSANLVAATLRSPAPPIDRNGYASILPFAMTNLTVAPAASPDGGAAPAIALLPNVSIGAGAVVTLALLPSLPDVDDAGVHPHAPQLLECIDNAGTLDIVGTCVVTPTDRSGP